ncbi:MAG: hypothetical protein RR539_10180 [Clostridium sp.]|uniref:hypothetical protein n=1 Tax=Clostridium sp. TaxID=1506 RepID=UPI002FCB1344
MKSEEKVECENKGGFVLEKHYFGLGIIFFSPVIAWFLGEFTMMNLFSDGYDSVYNTLFTIGYFFVALTIGICIFIWGLVERFK